MDRQESRIHEVWNFGEDGVTREVHPTAQVDVGDGFFREFSNNYLTEIWRRVPMFGRNSINGSVKRLGVPDFLRTNGHTWTVDLLDLNPSWGYIGSINNQNWGSQYRGGLR